MEGVTHDTIRHGTTTLFAALDVATGEGITQCRPCHRHLEFLGLLRQIETSVPEDLDVHLVVDNDCTRKHALDRRSCAQRQVRSWWAQRPRVHGHDTPTDASWLAESGGAVVGDPHQAGIRRGRFSSVSPMASAKQSELIARIVQFVAAYNKSRATFNRTATADSILEKLQ